MFFKLHKLAFTAATLGIAVAFLFGRDAFSYVSTSLGWVKESVRNTVPVEFEIERARKLVKDLVPDIRRNMHVIAQEEVEVERLDKQLAANEVSLAKEREEMLRLKNDLAIEKAAYEYGGRTYTVNQVKTDLGHRFERYKTHEATLASIRDIRAARSRSLDAARQKLEGMLAAKRQLEVDVENLDARLKMVEVAQTTSNYHIDDTQLGRARELIADVRTRLSVSERLVNVEDAFHDEIPLEAPTPSNITEQISEYFGSSDNQVASADSK